ncbi:hypothetical protein VTN49DRAFT_4759 [Thermomyces lanuginosus]|uniref:uncharacterized protein n=1 Tax=Thermomyces lanuginosus TaxID=5541 RepID=UPI00374433BD
MDKEIDLTEDKGPRILAVVWALTGVTTLIFSARVYIRLAWLRNFGLDDHLVLLGMVQLSQLFNFAYCGVVTAGVIHGFGKHTKAIDPNKLETVLLLNNISFLTGILSFTIPKLGIAALLNRILNRSKFQQMMLWLLTGFAAIVSCICIVVLFTMCDPPEAMWKPQLLAQGATCRDQMILVGFAIFTGSVAGFVDLFLAIYPSTVLMKLHMSMRKKVALCAALGLGSLACAMAIVKCVQLPGLLDTSDLTYSTADLVLWSCVETNVVVIGSCIPTLQPLLELILGKRGVTSSGRGDKYYKNSGYNSSSYGAGKPSISGRRDSLGFTVVESQESIIGDNQPEGRQNVLPLSQIRRTDDVTVNYEARGGSRSGVNSQKTW